MCQKEIGFHPTKKQREEMAELSKLQFQFYSGSSDMFATDTKKINGVTHSGPIRYIVNKQNWSLLGKYRWSIIMEKDVTDPFRASLAHGYGDTEEECFAEIDKWRENILSWLSPTKVRKGKITPKRGVQQ